VQEAYTPSEEDSMATTNTPETGAGSTDLQNATDNPTPDQVTQAGEVTEAEGARLAKEAAKAAKKSAKEPSARPDFTTVAESLTYDGIDYNDEGVLVNGDGKPIALASDATDLDVGWTAQHRNRDKPIHHPLAAGPASTPDQTFHPSELPNPQSALRAGLLPQNLSTLNVDPKKFEGKKSLEA
jgi:hypothetical protein